VTSFLFAPRSAVGYIGSIWSFHSGRICTAPTRTVVQRKIFDKVRAGLIEYAARLSVGDPRSMDTIVGPLISGAQHGRVENYVASSGKEGGDVVVGDIRPDFAHGFYVAPT
jgi:acyl-CoA reductase-like NAD-dependent aldehyde dehydrogenase